METMNDISVNFENFVRVHNLTVNINGSYCYSCSLDDYAEVVFQVTASGLLFCYLDCTETPVINLLDSNCPEDILQRLYDAYEEMCFQDFYNFVVEWSDITMISFESYK